jgi:hypothetical protein
MSHPPAEQTARAQQRCDGRGDAPLDVDEREVIDLNGSKYVNITSAAARILNMAEGDTVEVELHDDRYTVRKTDA